MAKNRNRSFPIVAPVIIALFAALASAGMYWQAVEHHLYRNGPLKRYGVIWDGKLTRSGLARNDNGWVWLRQQGVQSVVTFRTEDDIDYDRFGFKKVMHIPLTGTLMPTEQQAISYLEFIQDPANQPVHIHCSAGKDRTGMMAALVRYSIDGWSMDSALAEARQYRDFNKDLSKTMTAWLRNWSNSHSPGSFKRKSVAQAQNSVSRGEL
jgi:hypothetical protein